MLFTVVRERQNAAGSKTKTIAFISTYGIKLLKEINYTGTYSVAFSPYAKFKVCDQLNLAQD